MQPPIDQHHPPQVIDDILGLQKAVRKKGSKAEITSSKTTSHGQAHFETLPHNSTPASWLSDFRSAIM